MSAIETEIEIKWANGYQARVSVDIAHDALLQLRDEHGRISPDSVVSSASDKNHPLHAVFDWNNTAAAHQWRLEQARRLIRSIVVIRKDRPAAKARMFSLERVEPLQNNESPRNVYRSTEEMLADPDLRLQLLHRALNELVALQRKYRALQELAGVFRAIEIVTTTIGQEMTS